MPGWRWVARYAPVSLVVVTNCWLVPVLSTVTLALGTTAPCWSTMVPPIAPSVVDCAQAAAEPRASTNSNIAVWKNFVRAKDIIQLLEKGKLKFQQRQFT